MKIVFFGTPFFSAQILSYLLQKNCKIVAAVTNPDKSVGRLDKESSYLKEWITKNAPSIPLYQPQKASNLEFISTLANLKADLFVVVAFGQILKKDLLDLPSLGCINVHASLLPKYRGAAPMQRALIAGEKKTGVTIMKIAEKMDAGDILEKQEIDVDEEMDFGKLQEKLIEISGPLLYEVMQRIEKKKIHAVKQDETLATYAPKILTEECLIDWDFSAEKNHNLIRALSPMPGAYAWVQIKNERKKLKIFRSKVMEKAGNPGEILAFEKNAWIVGCQTKSLLLEEVQLEGKKRLSTKDFLLGFREKILFL
jgi:methionyl-tRNA formyltransferase